MTATVSVGPAPLLRGMNVADTERCATMVCSSAVGLRYGFRPDSMASVLAGALASGALLLVAELDGQAAGFAWIDPRGAFSSAPYLRLIAVDAELRGSGLGSALLAEFESRTASIGRDWFLLVSDFNKPAQAFYRRHGYRKAGALPDFARKGICEIIMVKKIVPLPE